MLSGVLPAREHRAVHPPLVRSRRRLTRSNAASERSATLLLQCAHRLLQSHDPRLLLLSARVFLRQHLYGKVVTVCDQIEAAMKQSKQASQSKQEEEEEKVVATARVMKHVATALQQKECGLGQLADGALGGTACFFRTSGDVMRLLRGEVTTEELRALAAGEEADAVLEVLRSAKSAEEKATQVGAGAKSHDSCCTWTRRASSTTSSTTARCTRPRHSTSPRRSATRRSCATATHCCACCAPPWTSLPARGLTRSASPSGSSAARSSARTCPLSSPPSIV